MDIFVSVIFLIKSIFVVLFVSSVIIKGVMLFDLLMVLVNVLNSKLVRFGSGFYVLFMGNFVEKL